MQIAALTEKYGGLTRYVFVKDLYEPVPPACREVTPIPMNDFSAQKEKLAAGFRGIKMEEKENRLWIQAGSKKWRFIKRQGSFMAAEGSPRPAFGAATGTEAFQKRAG
ncbi:hypothetical protein [Heyndrickxia coagulans]|uniref:hypothetical protein n=1 Tax=Heyndrickxia coagulans TaxID=1398 RepID=UPI002E1DF4CD|nr:hypothetical protein [Heyndrickxia coagulans]